MEKTIDYSKELLKFNQFLEQNMQKIMESVPFCSTISKDDEWFYEDEWDEDYKEFMKEHEQEN